MNFDIFIPVGPNDYEIVKYSLKNNKKRIESYKDILLYSEYKNFNFENTLDIDEDFFPFTKKEVHERVKNKDRSGWIYQQLVCLYYPYLQKKSEFVLVIDSDVFFTKNIKFFEEMECQVLLEIEKPLISLMQSLLPRECIFEKGSSLPKFDFHCPLMSLPHAFGTTLNNIPFSGAYFSAPGKQIETI